MRNIISHVKCIEKLKTLNFTRNQIIDNDLEVALKAIADNNELEKLYLDDNKIKSKGANVLSQLLNNKTKLKHLSNYIKEE